MDQIIRGATLGATAITFSSKDTDVINTPAPEPYVAETNTTPTWDNIVPYPEPYIVGLGGADDDAEFGPEHYKGDTAYHGDIDKNPENDYKFDDEDIVIVRDEPDEINLDTFDEGEIMVEGGEREPDENWEDQFWNVGGMAEGINPEDQNLDVEFLINFDKSWKQGEEVEALRSLFCNPEVKFDDFKNDHNGDFKAVQALLLRVLKEKMAEIQTGTFKLTSGMKREFYNLIDRLGDVSITQGTNLPPGTTPITLNAADNERLKKILKDLVKTLVDAEVALKKSKATAKQRREKYIEIIKTATGDEIGEAQLTAIINGAEDIFPAYVDREVEAAADTGLLAPLQPPVIAANAPANTQPGDELNVGMFMVPVVDEGNGPETLNTWDEMIAANPEALPEIIKKGIDLGLTEAHIVSQCEDAYLRAIGQEGNRHEHGVTAAVSDYIRTTYRSAWEAGAYGGGTAGPEAEPLGAAQERTEVEGARAILRTQPAPTKQLAESEAQYAARLAEWNAAVSGPALPARDMPLPSQYFSGMPRQEPGMPAGLLTAPDMRIPARTQQMDYMLARQAELGIPLDEAQNIAEKAMADRVNFGELAFQAMIDMTRKKPQDQPKKPDKPGKPGKPDKWQDPTKKWGPKKSEATWKGGVKIDPKTTLGRAYFYIQRSFRFFGGGYIMNAIMEQFTAEEFKAQFKFWNWTKKGVSMTGAFMVMFYLIGQYGYEPARVLNAMYTVASGNDVLTTGLVVFAVVASSLVYFPGVWEGHMEIVEEEGLRQTVYQNGLKLSMAAATGAGAAFVHTIGKMLKQEGPGTDIAGSVDRMTWGLSYALPLGLILYALGQSGMFGNNMGSRDVTERSYAGSLFRGGRRG